MYSRRRLQGIALTIVVVVLGAVITQVQASRQPEPAAPVTSGISSAHGPAIDTLKSLPIKGRAPKTGYTRTQFGDGWDTQYGCDTRNFILKRDLTAVTLNQACKVISGSLHDPYTDAVIQFNRGANTSDEVQIDHVVSLSNAWQTGAQALTSAQRQILANDPLELLAVDGQINQAKSDGDAATWLPPNKAFRCPYVARQVAVKKKYSLWVTTAERDAIMNVLVTCPDQMVPVS